MTDMNNMDDIDDREFFLICLGGTTRRASSIISLVMKSLKQYDDLYHEYESLGAVAETLAEIEEKANQYLD